MRGGTGYRPGPQTEALRQIVAQNYYRDAAGRPRRRTADDGGLPPSSSAIVSPYDTTARYVRHGHIIRWKSTMTPSEPRGPCPLPHRLGRADTSTARTSTAVSRHRLPPLLLRAPREAVGVTLHRRAPAPASLAA